MKNKEIKLEEDEEEDSNLIKYTPLQRILGYHLLDKDSFLGIPKAFLITTPIIVLIFILTLNLVNFTILSNKMLLIPADPTAISIFKESIYVGSLISVVPQIIIWAIIIHGLLIFLGGKGKFLRTLSIYSTAQIPIIIGLIVLTMIAVAQPTTQIYPYGFPVMGHYILEYNTLNFSFDIFQIFNAFALEYTIASNIIIPITNLYAMFIAARGLGAEHKVPFLISLFVAGLGYIASMLFYFVL